MQSDLIQHFEVNNKGKDFIVGDIHGHYDELMNQLKRIHFNFENDRLFSVGDLVDRGEQNREVLELLDENWFFAVRGNHEQMISDRYEHPVNKPAWSNTVKTKQDAESTHVANGGKWFDELETDEDRIHIYESIKELPYVITLNSGVQTLGIVHAEVPREFDHWSDFLSAVETSKEVRHEILYGRNEILGYFDYVSGEPVEDEYRQLPRLIKGIDMVIHGHTSTSIPVHGGNQLWIDTLSKSGALTILDVHELRVLITQYNLP
ncbi:MAG: metallophosphoesterase [Pseudomonadota bacterium]|nr:metallophosphoesterase [Pseudomonadota bacterium]